jgi:DNA-binding PadR family transcriptional regulator
MSRTTGRPSQTEMAVLGALSVEPMTAYAMREAIRDVLGHFWSESFGQIYPTLASAEAAGHVERSPGARSGSFVFTLTGSGKNRLRQLLGEPITVIPPRNGMLLRLFFGRALGVEGCQALLRTAHDDARRRLAEYDLLARKVSEEDRNSPDLPFQLLTISAARHTAKSVIAWAQESLSVLEALDSPAADPDRSPTT